MKGNYDTYFVVNYSIDVRRNRLFLYETRLDLFSAFAVLGGHYHYCERRARYLLTSLVSLAAPQLQLP